MPLSFQSACRAGTYSWKVQGSTGMPALLSKDITNMPCFSFSEFCQETPSLSRASTSTRIPFENKKKTKRKRVFMSRVHNKSRVCPLELEAGCSNSSGDKIKIWAMSSRYLQHILNMLKSCLCKSPKLSFKLVTNSCLSKNTLEIYSHEPIPLQFSIQQNCIPALMISSV